MLRMPKFRVAKPTTVDEAIALLAEGGENAMIVAGGTDLFPNVKHKLFEPELVVSLADVAELRGIRRTDDGSLAIGAMTTIDRVSKDPAVAAHAPALSQATGLIAGPQLRRMGTLGGNVMLDTRCQWYNQTYFWRKSLGFCLKKDGTECHVVAGGSKCVAAASNDSAPTLMSLGAELEFVGPKGRSTWKIDDIWKADGAFNKKITGDQILVEVRVPAQAEGHRGAYGKLRDRGSIDYPLLGVAVRLDLDSSGVVADADVVLVALQARPVRLRSVAETLAGTRLGTEAFDEAVNQVADISYKQCHPMPNIPGDHDYRKEMVPVFVRRTLHAAARGEGPVHHV